MQITSQAYIKPIVLCLAVLVFTGTAVQANPTWRPELNKHYRAVASLNNQPSEQSITLFCWLGSPSCYQLESALNEWASANGQEIAYQPVIKRPTWRMLAKARLVGREMQQEALVADAIYAKLHQDKQTIDSEEELFMLVEAIGMSASRFANLFYSAEINALLKDYEEETEQLGLRGVPSLIVDNRWLLDAGMLKTPREFLYTIEFLLQDKISP